MRDGSKKGQSEHLQSADAVFATWYGGCVPESPVRKAPDPLGLSHPSVVDCPAAPPCDWAFGRGCRSTGATWPSSAAASASSCRRLRKRDPVSHASRTRAALMVARVSLSSKLCSAAHWHTDCGRTAEFEPDPQEGARRFHRDLSPAHRRDRICVWEWTATKIGTG